MRRKLRIRLVKVKMNAVHVIDGDTIDGMLIWWNWLRRSEIQTRIRLAGIDAPEMKPVPEPFAQEATDYLAALIEGRTITVQFAMDRITKEWVRESGGTWERRRLLGILYKGWSNQSLNVELVRQGLAKIYPTPTWMVKWFEQQLAKAQREAQRKKRGLWRNALTKGGKHRVFWVCVGFIIALVVLFIWAS